MFVQERVARILEALDQRPRQSVTDLQERLGVSRSTLRRDLIDLEAAGEVLRVHGGVVRSGAGYHEPTFDRKQQRSVRAKQAIAEAAVERLPSEGHIYIDGGSTCLRVARLLLVRPETVIWTNSIRLLAEAENARAVVNCVGGQVRPRSQSLFGGVTSRWLADLRFDVAVLGASGLDDAGPRTADLHDATAKQSAMASAESTVLVADSQKWNAPAPVRFAAWDQIDVWVVDGADVATAGLPREVVRAGNGP